jgi:hypothetical protein
MILTISAVDREKQPLPLLHGSIVPEWGGVQAGLPGKAFAKVLSDALTSEFPVVSYWKQTFIASDNRIPAMGSDTSLYTFAIPSGVSTVTVAAELLFRRTFQSEMDARGWNTPDIRMETGVVEINTQPRWVVYLPLMGR